ncbi:MAG: ATP-dependent DNA helicase DinG, partial [Spirochaetaceae bacterium]|nr:ATP-dependent DNA helicase DinG [Spirochaetaceae bacterium]
MNEEYQDEYGNDFYDDEDIERPIQKLDSEKIIAELEEGGAIARNLPLYENRSSQLDLMRLIINAFNEETLAAAEAGTGVGKSFAYLLPAVSFALLNDERIVISSSTITLQQQLFEKDIPLVLRALNADIKTVLVKGRGNFVCKRRLQDAALETPLLIDDNAESAQIQEIVQWAESSKTGAKSELSFLPKESLWANIRSESDACAGSNCPFREMCFIVKLRRQAQEARILVVNHHLLFADLQARRESADYESSAVLPPYSRVIMDEAHTMEHSATSFFSEQWSKLGLFRHITRLYRRRGAAKKGLLLRLQAFTGGPDPSAAWEEIIERIREAVNRLDEAALSLCGRESVFRLIAERDNIITERLGGPLNDVRNTLLAWIDTISLILQHIEKTEQETNANTKEAGATAILIREVRSCLKQLSAIAENCMDFLEYKNHSSFVFWIERRSTFSKERMKEAGGSDWALFTKAPLDVSQILKVSLFENNKTVVCLSATLTVADKFDYWIGRTGINLALDADGESRSLFQGRFPSPFPYSSSVLLAVPGDAPLPEERSFRNFVNEAILRLAETSEGAALVLFTSFDSLNSAFAHAQERLHTRGILCLKQGDDDRSRLLKTFLENKKSVLFATDSFWEGVDAPG